jgi:hypothetical protein
MTLSIPQSIQLSLMFFTTCVNIFKNGQVKPRVNFYVTFLGWLFELYVLSTTAFFNNFEIPQFLWGTISLLGLTGGVVNHGRVPKGYYDGPAATIAFGIILTIYYFGGFFGG